VSKADEFNRTLGAVMRAEASFHGFSAAALSRMTGIERVTLGRYLKGERDIPIPILYKVADALNVTVASLVEAAHRRVMTSDTGAMEP
jgi:transcriptional regulator with XRE-family HTH domain